MKNYLARNYMKKLTIIGVIAAGVVAIGCATLGDANGDDTKVNQAKWQKKTPQLFNNAGYVGLTQTSPKVIDLPESIEELRGPITNPFGIRDDILEYILKNIPSNNESAVRAAIKSMQYLQQIYFDNPTESEAMSLQAKYDLSDLCMMNYLNKDKPLGIWRIMRNTKARDEYMWQVDRKYFSWKVMGTGLTTADEEIACQKGEF